MEYDLHLWISERGTRSTIHPKLLDENYIGFHLKGGLEQLKGFLSYFFACYGLPDHRERALEELLFGEEECWYANCGPLATMKNSKKRYIIIVPLFGKSQRIMLTTNDIEGFVDGMSKVPLHLEFHRNKILSPSEFHEYNNFEFIDTQILSQPEVRNYFSFYVFHKPHVKLPTLDLVRPMGNEGLCVKRIIHTYEDRTNWT